jgi:two-component system, LytTR family, response regulator
MPTDDRIRTVIAAAEPAALWALRQHAGREPELEVIAECLDGESAVSAINRMEPDLLVLDVPDTGSDFDVLNQVKVDPEPVVVLVTPEDSYPPDTFEYAPSELLLKPFDGQRFRLAIKRARHRIQRRRGTLDQPLPLEVPGAGDTDISEARQVDRLLVKHDGEIVVLPVDTIRWIASAGNYLRLHAQDRTYVIRMTISEMSDLLDPKTFARIHRTTVVNMRCVSSFRHLASSSYLVRLDDGTELRMSRMYSRNVMAAHYLGGRPFES